MLLDINVNISRKHNPKHVSEYCFPPHRYTLISGIKNPSDELLFIVN